MPKVLLTRPRVRSSEGDELHRILLEAGITIEELPMLRFESPADCRELDQALHYAAQGEFDAVLLSSPTAVNVFEERTRELGLLEMFRQTVRFGAVGQATAKELTALGIEKAFPIPMHAGSHELAAILSEYNLAGSRVLLLQSNIGLEVLEDALVKMGAIPERVTLYYTEGPSVADAARLVKLLEGDARPDVIAFFSPSAFQNFARALAEMGTEILRNLPALASIGETTAHAVEESLHRRPEIVARKADQASLANDIVQYLRLKR
jgi:uroporphyrinogen-III synthase